MVLMFLYFRDIGGMVFANPIPLPCSIFENVAFASPLHQLKNESELPGLVKKV